MSTPAVSYVANFFTAEESILIFHELVNAPYNNAIYNPLRKMCVYTDEDILHNISGILIQPHRWTKFLLAVKTHVEKELKCNFNYALVSFFKNGYARLSPRTDEDSRFDVNTPTATVSVGATRAMTFTKKGHSTLYYELEPGSLLTVYNQEWNYSLPSQVNITEPTISVKFRKMISFVRIPSYELNCVDDDDDVDNCSDRELSYFIDNSLPSELIYDNL